MKLTNDILLKGCSDNGGWNYAQFELLGIPVPPPKGWKKRIVGMEYPDAVITAFLGLTNTHLTKKD